MTNFSKAPEIKGNSSSGDNTTYDLVVIGGGPGGYTAAIRATQLGLKVALVEKDKLGGVCLNRGCIPTKALLKSAHAVHEVKELKSLGINTELLSLDGNVAMDRAQAIAQKLSKGVEFLMKKNKITVIKGDARFETPQLLHVKNENNQTLRSKNFIIATGARYRQFPGLTHNGKNIIGAYEALVLEKLPESIGIIGAGAIGVEFAYFWNAFGVKVHIFERLPHLLPLEDTDSSVEIERAYKKYGITYTLGVSSITAEDQGKNAKISTVDAAGKKSEHIFDKILLAVGMTGNIEDCGFEKIGLKTESGFIKVDPFCRTNLPNIYAIGDVSGPPLLAHVASHQGMIAAETIAGLKPHPIDPNSVPACTYCIPQVASVGLTERKLQEMGTKFKVGKLPFLANGKAIASNEKEGHIKVLLGDHGELLGAHIVGVHATELIHEYTLYKTMEGISENIRQTIHPHPTLGEWLSEAILHADNQAINV
jgi:dihydrolipoamide dehydrogenase